MIVENWEQYKDLEYYPDRYCGCGCGGRIKVKPYHEGYGIPEYISGHNCRGSHWTIERKEKRRGKNSPNWVPRETRNCGCNCGGTFECKVNSKKRFISGHNAKCRSKEANKKLAEVHIGKHHTEETKKKIGEGNKGKIVSEETRGKLRKVRQGRTSSKETKKKMKETKIKLWQDPEYREKQLNAIFKGLKLLPNKPEKFLDKLLQKLFPNEWKYVGDGQFILAGKCPDFINIAGQKKIIEFNGDYWHGEELTGRTKEEEEQQRIDLFTQYGYQTLIIWENELEDIDVTTDRLIEFCRTN